MAVSLYSNMYKLRYVIYERNYVMKWQKVKQAASIHSLLVDRTN
jgi:hypothetical protein